MSIASLEYEISVEAKAITGDNKLRMEDIMEWSTGDIEAQENEVLYHPPRMDANIAVKG